MQLTLLMTTTINGYIATKDHNVDWVSEASWNHYQQTVKDVGHVIIGRETYELMPEDEFVDGCHYIVCTTKKDSLPQKCNPLEFFNGSPEQLVSLLDSRGTQKALLCGGANTITRFMKAGLIDEMLIDIEPSVLGDGIPLFEHADMLQKFTLLSANPQPSGTLFCHYTKNA